MQFATLLATTAAALVASTAAQLAGTVPPPACLKSCMTSESLTCSLCSSAGNSAVQACVSSTCGPKDVTYANAYYGSVCTEGGYIDFSQNPHTMVQVPAAACATATPAASKEKRFQA